MMRYAGHLVPYGQPVAVGVTSGGSTSCPANAHNPRYVKLHTGQARDGGFRVGVTHTFVCLSFSPPSN
jgi:hypothetical protein